MLRLHENIYLNFPSLTLAFVEETINKGNLILNLFAFNEQERLISLITLKLNNTEKTTTSNWNLRSLERKVTGLLLSAQKLLHF